MAFITNKTTPTTSTYSGIAFPPRKKAGSGFFATDTDLDLISDSIYVLLNTRKGEMPMVPDFGSSAASLLFQPINDITIGLITDALQNDVARWEPRVTVLEIMSATADNQVIFQLTLQMKATGQTTITTLSFPTS